MKIQIGYVLWDEERRASRQMDAGTPFSGLRMTHDEGIAIEAAQKLGKPWVHKPVFIEVGDPEAQFAADLKKVDVEWCRKQLIAAEEALGDTRYDNVKAVVGSILSVVREMLDPSA